MEFFFGQGAIQNYFSEILGIGLSVLILPFLIKFYYQRKNRSLKYMFLDPVFSFSKHLVDKYLPDSYKESWEYQRYSNKRQDYFIFQSIRLINLDDEKIEGDFISKLERLSSLELEHFIDELMKDFNELEGEINSWLLIYKNVTSDELSQLIHKLLYELRSFKYKYGQYLDIDNSYVISNFADYVTTIIFELIKLYRFVLSEYPFEEEAIKNNDT